MVTHVIFVHIAATSIYSDRLKALVIECLIIIVVLLSEYNIFRDRDNVKFYQFRDPIIKSNVNGIKFFMIIDIKKTITE